MVIKTSQLMMYKANVVVYFDILTKHSTQSEHHVEFLILNLLTTRKPLGFKRLILYQTAQQDKNESGN